MAKIKFLYSLKSRIIIIMTLSFVIVITLILLYYLNYIQKNEYQRNQENLVNSATHSAEKIQGKLNSYINISKTLALNFEGYKQINEENRRTVFDKFLKNSIVNNSEILAIWTKFKPYTIDNLDKEFENTVLGTSGQYIKCYYRAKNEIEEKEIEFYDEIEFEMKQYTAFFGNNQGAYLHAPIVNFYSKSFLDTTYIVSIISPIYDNKKFIGVVAIDISTQNIIADNEDALIEETILNDDFNILYSKNKKLITNNYLKIYNNLFSNYNIINNLTEEKPTYIHDKINNQEDYTQTIFLPLTFNLSNQKWTYIQQYSDIEKNQTFINVIYFTLFISLAILVLVVIASFVITNLLNNIFNIFTDFLKNVSKGIFNVSENKIEKFSTIELQEISEHFRIVSENLSKLEDFANEIKSGNLEAEYSLLSQKDLIGLSLQNMQANLKKNIQEQKEREAIALITRWTNQGVADFGDILRKNLGNLENLTFETISSLVKYLDAVQGGIFIYNDDDPNDVYLELSALFAFDRRRYDKKSIKLGEGLVGTCALERKTVYVNKIPEDYMEITSGLGTSKPNSILIVPLIYNLQIYGVMEIAKLEVFNKHQIDFAERIAESIASTLASAKISSKTTLLLNQANERYEKLLEKEKEMQNKYDELLDDFNKVYNQEREKNDIVNSINEIIFYAEFDLSFTLLKINGNLLKFLKTTYDEALSKNYYELFDVKMERFDEHSRILSNLKIGIRQEYVFDIKIAGENLWLKCMFNPVYNTEKQITRFFLFAFDNTQFIIKENENRKLIEETQLKAEQIDIQEQEMVNIFEELSVAQEEINKLENDKKSLYKEIERQEKRIEFYKKELEKRIARFKKIETNLKEKIKNLEADK